MAPDGGGLFYDLLPLQLGGTLVRNTAARIATHAHATPPATQPAITQASQTLFGCALRAGQVHCDEELHDGGLHAGQVACERSVRLYLFESLLVDYLHGQKSKHMLWTALLRSVGWHVLLEHARDRGRSAGDGPIYEHA